MIDFNSLMLAPSYAILGVTCNLTFSNSKTATLTGIDKTSGIQTGNNKTNVDTILPAVVFRMDDLNSQDITPDDLIDADLEMNGVNWRIMNTKPKPNTQGEQLGELLCTLQYKTVLAQEGLDP